MNIDQDVSAVFGYILVTFAFVYFGSHLMAWRAGVNLAGVIVANWRDLLLSAMLTCGFLTIWPH